MPTISQRGINMPASPIRKLSPLADDAKNKNIKVLHLNIGQPDLPSPQKALNALKHINRTTLEYSPSQGFKSLRDKLVSYYSKYNIELSSDEIMVTCGGSEALLLAFLSCLNPGDEIIMTEPSYANYLGIAQAAGVVVKTVTSTIENSFALPSITEFEKAVTHKTKAILICNPNNPTGYVYSKEELLQLKDIVLKHDLYLIADEVYREFIYNGVEFFSALRIDSLRDNVIVVDSVSKRYSECGIRIGMLLTHNADVRNAVLKFEQSRLSPPLLGQLVAEASIEGTEDYSKQCYDEYKARRDFFISGLNKIEGVYSPMPQGAFYTVVSLPVDDAEAFCRWCLSSFSYKPEGDKSKYDGYTVMFAPASGFYENREIGKKQVRMAYVLCQEDLKIALECLELALKQYNSK